MIGPVASTTVTAPLAWLNAPFGSVTVSCTGDVVPSAYGPAGDWTNVSGSPSGSNDPSSTDALAVQAGPAGTVTALAFATGGWFGGSQAPRQAFDTVSVY